jgi:nucleotide-binding universal stress UspA family protein
MVKKILLATDLSAMCEASFQVALGMARRLDCKLHILHVLESGYSGKYRHFVKDISTGNEIGVTGEYVESVEESIRSIYAPRINGFTDYEILVRYGFPYLEILRVARSGHMDLIVMAPHTRITETEEVVRMFAHVGSTVEGVTASSRCPVMIVGRPPQHLETFKNILMATDFSKCSDYAVDFAFDMAKQCAAKLSIFSVPELMPAPGKLCCPQAEIEMHLALTKKKLMERYVSKLEGFDNYVIDAWEGIPYVEILKFARIQEIDAIVMGPHAKEHAPSWYLGNTLEQVTMRSQCPVMVTCRPESLRYIDELKSSS